MLSPADQIAADLGAALDALNLFASTTVGRFQPRPELATAATPYCWVRPRSYEPTNALGNPGANAVCYECLTEIWVASRQTETDLGELLAAAQSAALAVATVDLPGLRRASLRYPQDYRKSLVGPDESQAWCDVRCFVLDVTDPTNPPHPPPPVDNP